jgi:hypothetical protein
MAILQIVVAGLTIITGLVSLIRPRAIKSFTGLDVTGSRGVTEIRAVLGGAFIGLGAAPLLLNTPQSFQMLGITYLVIGVVRAVTMFVDRSVMLSNIISLAVEIIFGVLLVF